MAQDANKPVILLADDDDVIRNMGRDILHILGYQVILAGNGEETVSLYRQNSAKVDLILLDWHMPGLTGMEILEQLWAINPEVKVVLATGLGQPREIETIRKSGHTVSLLQKPYLVKDLQSELSRLVNL
ncbi:MAG: response regulator [Candidatus Zixiibacteriota bacterium]|nr:MAG: response regulator [candidate division Zixibacteria bacterium]